MNLRNISILTAVLGFVESSALASFHEVIISEVCTGANGNTGIQYVELEMLGPSENFVSGHNLVSKTSAGAVLNTFTVNANVAAGAGRKILLGTAAFASVGGVTPDFTLPANFLSPNGGQVSWVDSVETAGTVSYAPYSGTGVNGTAIQTNNNADNLSLTRIGDTGNDNNDFASQNNTPTNNSNVTGHIPPPAAVNDWHLY